MKKAYYLYLEEAEDDLEVTEEQLTCYKSNTVTKYRLQKAIIKALLGIGGALQKIEDRLSRMELY